MALSGFLRRAVLQRGIWNRGGEGRRTGARRNLPTTSFCKIEGAKT